MINDSIRNLFDTKFFPVETISSEVLFLFGKSLTLFAFSISLSPSLSFG